jgi:serine/threonine protein kinase
MLREVDLVLAHIALDQKFITAAQFGKLLREASEREKRGEAFDIAAELVERGLVAGAQLATLERLRSESDDRHLVKGYEILGILGHGAMGCVYLARQLSMDRQVALKVLPHELARDKHYLERFVREARSTARLNHVNIVQGFDVGYARGLNYFAMEYVKGRTLRELLDDRRMLPEAEVVEIAVQVGRALQHAWELGIVHRDIKPDNVMITESGVVKVTDLGLAKPQDGDGDLTSTGIIVGTPNYMSPEQGRGLKAIDTRSDLYSLGVMLFQLLTGELPFRSPSPTVVITRHITEVVPSPQSRNAQLSDGICEIVKVLCAKSPDDRYSQPEEMVADLEALKLGLPSRRGPRKADLPQFKFRPCYVPTEDEVYFIQIALHNKVVTIDQVRRCLELQETLSEVGSVQSLPDIMADQGVISRRHLEKILEAQRLQPRKAPDSFFGRIATKLGLVSRAQVKEALARQKELRGQGRHRRIGDILEAIGYLELKDKVRVLTEQARIRQALENRRFGNIAIRLKFVTRWQLEEALRIQERQISDNKPVERLGTILVDEGLLTEQARRVILRSQRRHEMTGESIVDLVAQVVEEGMPADLGRPSLEADLGGLFDNVQIKGMGVEICPFCGNRLRAGAIACSKCGRAIELAGDDPTWG